jgi:hypothetical protein
MLPIQVKNKIRFMIPYSFLLLLNANRGERVAMFLPLRRCWRTVLAPKTSTLESYYNCLLDAGEAS